MDLMDLCGKVDLNPAHAYTYTIPFWFWRGEYGGPVQHRGRPRGVTYVTPVPLHIDAPYVHAYLILSHTYILWTRTHARTYIVVDRSVTL